MKKIIFAGLTAIVFSCAIGLASAYTAGNSQPVKKAARSASCACSDCACEHCACTDCKSGHCDAGCCNSNTNCSKDCCKK